MGVRIVRVVPPCGRSERTKVEPGRAASDAWGGGRASCDLIISAKNMGPVLFRGSTKTLEEFHQIQTNADRPTLSHGSGAIVGLQVNRRCRWQCAERRRACGVRLPVPGELWGLHPCGASPQHFDSRSAREGRLLQVLLSLP